MPHSWRHPWTRFKSSDSPPCLPGRSGSAHRGASPGIFRRISFSFDVEPAAALPPTLRRRRTFAIISHPDAGKTTLTEKLLLYGGAIHLAGSVKSRRAQRHAASDWMELEQQRGISVTSSVMQFEYEGYQINLLHTPGHEDVSDDPYHTHVAAGSAGLL